MHSQYIINTFLKLLSINICLCLTYFKISNSFNTSKYKNLFIISSCILLSALGSYLRIYLSNQFVSLVIYFLLNWLLSKYAKIKFGFSIIITIISLSITYIAFFISTLIIFSLIEKFNIFDFTNPLCLMCIRMLRSVIHFFII